MEVGFCPATQGVWRAFTPRAGRGIHALCGTLIGSEDSWREKIRIPHLAKDRGNGIWVKIEDLTLQGSLGRWSNMDSLHKRSHVPIELLRGLNKGHVSTMIVIDARGMRDMASNKVRVGG